MPRDVVALVSADDAIAAIRVHADRVHDLLRRSGCGAEESVEVTESYAFALIDALVNAPERVGDMAGWWFGRALELSRRVGAAAAEPAVETPTSVLAGTTGEAQVRAALAGLPESERAAVMLRDAYDLPPQAVAVALGRDEESAAALIAVGRLHLVSRYDSRPPPDLSSHTGRSPADLAALSSLADGTLAPQRTVGLRRHLGACVACEDMADALAKGRRLAAALPVIAMPDEAREAMLQHVAARATQVLPSVDQVLLAIEEDDEDRPAISPLMVVLAIALALILGVAVAAITHIGTSGSSAPAALPTAAATSITPSFSVSPTASTSSSATASSSASASASATQSASPSPTARRTFVLNPAVTVRPAQGPSGTHFTVHGTGWAPGDTITVRYSGPVSSSRASTVADSAGRFTVTMTANGLVPGDYTVAASGSSGTSSTSFRQTS